MSSASNELGPKLAERIVPVSTLSHAAAETLPVPSWEAALHLDETRWHCHVLVMPAPDAADGADGG